VSDDRLTVTSFYRSSVSFTLDEKCCRVFNMIQRGIYLPKPKQPSAGWMTYLDAATCQCPRVFKLGLCIHLIAARFQVALYVEGVRKKRTFANKTTSSGKGTANSRACIVHGLTSSVVALMASTSTSGTGVPSRLCGTRRYVAAHSPSMVSTATPWRQAASEVVLRDAESALRRRRGVHDMYSRIHSLKRLNFSNM
jgi:hypothetical protein